MIKSNYGYAGNILRVKLNNLELTKEPTDSYTQRFLGGRGINQWILLKELKPWVTPFEPANIICYGTGPFTGTLVPGASRLNIDSKNPFTGGIGSGSAGGWFGSEMKFAGYDNIVVGGKAKEPVYLFIDNEHVTFRPAWKMWGKTVSETMGMIKEDVGDDDVEILCIGPAGENIVRSACVVVSGSRVTGRCGLGAVMGSKNLKAIAVRGSGSVGVKHPGEFISLTEKISKRLRNSPEHKVRKEVGTFFVTPIFNALSAVPFKNFQDDYIPEEFYSKISQEVYKHFYNVDTYACSACPTPCGQVYSVKDGPYSGTRCLKAEGNTVWNFGGRLAINEPGAILKAQEDCAQLGLDIDSVASSIGWAIDCYQNKIISKEDTDGVELNWGDHSVILDLIRKIAYREGFGNVLAEGSLRAAEIVGNNSKKYAFHIKGQDLIEAIRSMKGWALGVVVSPRGGAHTRGAPVTEARQYSRKESNKLFGVETAGIAATYKGKAKVVNYIEKICALLDSLGVCLFTGNWASPLGINPGELAKYYFLITGKELSEGELMQTGERIHNIEKMFNIYHAGFTRKDDYPPKRFMKEKIKSGPLKGELLREKDWNRMLDEYYELNEWDLESGWPNREKLEKLKIGECIDYLECARKNR